MRSTLLAVKKRVQAPPARSSRTNEESIFATLKLSGRPGAPATFKPVMGTYCSEKRLRLEFHTRPPLRMDDDPNRISTLLAPLHTNIPFRLDRLPWSNFHLLVVVGLGITWILDGLEVTIVGSLGPALQSSDTLNLSSADLGAVASSYVAGAVLGALGFGWVTDRYGRRLVFYLNSYRLSFRGSSQCFCMGFLEFCFLSPGNRFGHWGRVRSGQLCNR